MVNGSKNALDALAWYIYILNIVHSVSKFVEQLDEVSKATKMTKS